MIVIITIKIVIIEIVIRMIMMIKIIKYMYDFFRCPTYVGIPSYCQMAQDPDNKCCQKPACNVCPHTPAPVSGKSHVSVVYTTKIKNVLSPTNAIRREGGMERTVN